LESLLAFFASFVLESDVVRQIMRWDMTVLRESPWYQEILREGERQGELRGRQEGRQEEGRSLILKLLTRRVGELSPEVTTQIEALSIEQLETLGEALLDFSKPEDLANWLNDNG
jgi:predicted transposase YdaD